MQQLTALQARYDSLETEKRNSLLNISVVQSALVGATLLDRYVLIFSGALLSCAVTLCRASLDLI